MGVTWEPGDDELRDHTVIPTHLTSGGRELEDAAAPAHVSLWPLVYALVVLWVAGLALVAWALSVHR